MPSRRASSKAPGLKILQGGKSRRKPQKKEDAITREFEQSRGLRIFAIICILLVTTFIFLQLFEPGLDYKLSAPPAYAIDSPQFIRELSALADARVSPHTQIDVFPNGENYYEAELDAIRHAQKNINLEAYIFHKGQVAQRFVDALTERARAGVRVSLVLDAVGSFSTPKHYFRDLRQAGARVFWYHPMRWNTLFRYNNRTHREMLIVDGDIGFLGGAGIADHWLISKDKERRWRDEMFRVQGDAVSALQGTFVENWLEASGEVIAGPAYFPFTPSNGTTQSLVVNSTPSSGLSTRARILFQTLVAAAHKSILITTPYFLPDDSLSDELVRARQRGVEVKIVVPGKHSDHSMTRSSSRSKYGDLLKAGAEIYEYEPAMIHVKSLVVDGTWVVVGSTNFDSRSFGINDEINLAALDPKLASTMTQIFNDDVTHSERVNYDQWRKRGPIERAQEWLGWLIERQQ